MIIKSSAAYLDELIQRGNPFISDEVYLPEKKKYHHNNSNKFELITGFVDSGDQKSAIDMLVQGLNNNHSNQILLGATGTGKTYTMARIIQESQKPTLILAPNKILAAQLWTEFKHFFPKNAVEYFVSYFDYFQPESYIPKRDQYIEKTSQINDELERLRHSTTQSLLNRNDTIVVASISCIFGLGSVDNYEAQSKTFFKNQKIKQREFLDGLVSLQYQRLDRDFSRSKIRVRGDIIDIWPVNMDDTAIRFEFFDDVIEEIYTIDAISGQKIKKLEEFKLYGASHFTMPKKTLESAIIEIEKELDQRLIELITQQRILEANRLEKRTRFDLEMMKEVGYCVGMENYSFHFNHRKANEPNPSLIEYLPDNALMLIDESHVAIPQLKAMSKAAFRMKATLTEYGFRLPSCMTGRPLRFEEWQAMKPQTIYVSATPGKWELENSDVVAEQIIRPTYIVDPVVQINGIQNQVDDVMANVLAAKNMSGRSLVITLTKKNSELLCDYFNDHGIKSKYMHSDVDTLERINLINDLRSGIYDCLIGVNLLREGLDIPECIFVGILDADKEGFLRSKDGLIQMIGRAARNINGKVTLYADTLTESIKAAMSETNRRRKIQLSYNKTHYKKPLNTTKIHKILNETTKIQPQPMENNVEKLMILMREHALNHNFEEAAIIRDKLKKMGAI